MTQERLPTEQRALSVRGGILAAALVTLAVATTAGGHPLSQGALEVTVYPDKVAVRARVTVEEMTITNMLTTPDAPDAASAPATGPSAQAAAAAEYGRHARYLAAHVHVSADGRPLAGRVAAVHPPETGTPDAPVATANQRAVYDLEYTRPKSAEGSEAEEEAAGWDILPSKVELSQDVLVNVDFLPGQKWDASYVVRFAQPDGRAAEGLLLTTREPLKFATEVGRWGLFKQFLYYGIRHIVPDGWDHLLFISALVLGATRLWDLAKVVTAFTLAHTVTLTLAALKLVNLPAHVVEPMIAASIVFVAVQNVFWPKRSRGWGRLAAAFFFGLFHGLGFAGPLLFAMQGMEGLTIVLAILAFSLGVEIGHQVVVLPLFAGLKVARKTRETPEAKDRLSVLAQRFGSAAISVAGTYYLVMALFPGLGRAGS